MRRSHVVYRLSLWATTLAAVLVASSAAAETTLIIRLPNDKYDAAAEWACDFFGKCTGEFVHDATYIIDRLVSFNSFTRYKGMESLGMSLEVRRDE